MLFELPCFGIVSKSKDIVFNIAIFAFKLNETNMETVLAFLGELNENNNREWFQANKDWYQEARAQFDALVENVIKGITAFDNDLQLLTAKDCTFRIYRDVRFSKNKVPYKTNMGAAFSKGGRKSKYASYYLHIEPGNCFVGGGKWMPASDELKSIRYEIFNFPQEFIKILEAKDFKEAFGELSGDKLIRPPKDFPADFPYIELIKFKSFTAGRQLSDELVKSKDILPVTLKYLEILNPFIKYLNRAVENV